MRGGDCVIARRQIVDLKITICFRDREKRIRQDANVADHVGPDSAVDPEEKGRVMEIHVGWIGFGRAHRKDP